MIREIAKRKCEMLLHYSPAAGPSVTPEQSKSAVAVRPVAPGTDANDPNTSETSASAQQRQELLFTLQNSKRIKAEDLSSSQRKLFKNLTCTREPTDSLRYSRMAAMSL